MKPTRLLHLVAKLVRTPESPGNLLHTLRTAMALGVRFVELDVHLSPHGVPMVGCETLARTLALLDRRPDITAFITVAPAAVFEFGHAQVVGQVVRVLKPLRSRCVLVSHDLPTICAARQQAGYAVGWILTSIDAHTRIKYEALQPEYLFCASSCLPPRLPLWRGPWRWVVHEDTPDLQATLALAERGVDFIVTHQVGALNAVMRGHAAERLTRSPAVPRTLREVQNPPGLPQSAAPPSSVHAAVPETHSVRLAG
jgi:hypothetical protein